MIQIANIGDKIKIVSEQELKSLYDEKDFHQNNTLQSLLLLSNNDLIGYVNNVKLIGDELYEYDISFPKVVQSIKLYDSDFYVVRELYTQVPVYLCVDSQGGMCDRLCFDDMALIKNANASIDSWNSLQDTEHHEYVTNVENAISVLSTDNFNVVKLEPNTVHITDEYIISDCNIMCYGYDTLIHSPKHIWEQMQKGTFLPKNLIVDLTVTTDDI